MGWKKIRIDFATTVKCQFCPRHITSGKAVIVQHDNGMLSYAGPSCAKDPNKVDNPKEKIIDVTKGCVEEHISTKKEVKIAINTEQDENLPTSLDFDNYFDENAAKAYLLLRFEKLAHIQKISDFKSKKLNSIYQKYVIENKISLDDEKYLSMVMHGKKYPEFTYKSLQSLYATDFWLRVFLEKKPEHKFIKSLLEQLHQNLSLSKPQMEKLNECFTEVKGMKITLKTNSFGQKKAPFHHGARV
ncbi:hypothetical protein [Rodentibacter caecimuris]|uniref:Uncharacterized protein n=1 Tax=Rodentibacter caecimuris TaxID=1796644 RepID=A0AAJ3MZ37_9PAST|nr:hypothetical protein [Rodentibacter heylii]OOF72424.1 hypothetical protein BKG90_04325 [Rodentibacter heylii]OOF75714.1 hypothetical protein BKG99_07620 [Rodentibacter heylii]